METMNDNQLNSLKRVCYILFFNHKCVFIRMLLKLRNIVSLKLDIYVYI